MRPPFTARKGFSITEVLIVITLMAILAGVILVNLSETKSVARESELKAHAAVLRNAVFQFQRDHGFFPCSSRMELGENYSVLLVDQLTRYTNAAGEIGREKTDEFCFGPYLRAIPIETITGSGSVEVNTSSNRSRSSLVELVATGDGSGGWYYEARSGLIVANLGSQFESKYVKY